MKLLADESVDRAIVTRLRADGHTYVAELTPGISDDEVLQHANDDNTLLLTADKDFGELIFRQGRASGGVVLARLGGLATETKAEIIAEVFRDHAAESNPRGMP